MIIDEGAQPASAESVRIQNLGGFTGMYARGDGSSADMSMSGDKFTITGTANGFKTDKPNEAASADLQNHRDLLTRALRSRPGACCGDEPVGE